MVDTVSRYVVFDGPTKAMFRMINEGDGTGEAAQVVKIDVSDSDNSGDGINPGPNPGVQPASLTVLEIQYSVQGFEAVAIEFDATANTTIALLSGDGILDLRPGFHDPRTTGWTGDIVFRTIGAYAAGDSYDISLLVRKQA